jgi:hypothetical protein
VLPCVEDLSFVELPLAVCAGISAKQAGGEVVLLAKKSLGPLLAFALSLFGALSVHAQRVRGELRIEVRDQQGAALAPNAALISDGNQLRRTFQVDADGDYVAQDLPFGVYRLSLSAEGG